MHLYCRSTKIHPLFKKVYRCFFENVHAWQVDDIEQQRVSPDQMVTVGQTQLLYIDVDEFLSLRKVEDKIPRIYLQLVKVFT